MTRPYGRTPRGGPKAPAAPESTELRIRLTERHTLEQLALELQRAVAILQDHGIYGVERFRVQLQPLDEQGKPVAVFDADGQQLMTIDIPEPPEAQPYRENEPGVGVSPEGPGSRRAAPRTPLRPSGHDPSRK